MLVLLAAAILQQQDIYETRYRHQQEILSIQGVKSVDIAGVDGKLVLVVRVTDEAARDRVSAKYGDKLGGHALHIIVTAPAQERKSPETRAPEKKPQEPRPVATVKDPDPRTLNDYRLPFFPGKKPKTSTDPMSGVLETEDGLDLSGLVPKPKDAPVKTPADSSPGVTRGPRTTQSGEGPTRNSGSTQNPITRNDPGTTQNPITRNDPGTSGNTITRNDPGTTQNPITRNRSTTSNPITRGPRGSST